MKDTLISLGRLMHEMQKERSFALLYLCSDGTLYADRIGQKFLESDYAIEVLTSIIPEKKTSGSFEHGIAEKLSQLFQGIETACQQRALILEQKMSAAESVTLYSHEIIGPIINVMIDIALTDPNNNSAYVSAFANFIHLKERIGRERALGIRGLIRDAFRNTEFIENYRFLVSEQASYKNTFLALANDDQKACYARYMQDYAVTRMEEMHQLMAAGKSEEGYNISPIDWYELVTQKIDLMHNVEIDLIETLALNNSNDNQQKDPEFKHSQIGIDQKQKEFILTLPVFHDLSDETFNNLFRNATIRKFKKGNLLFLEGELPNRLYIILEGWVKLYKGNANGDETILQMLSSGDMIAESAVFLNAPFPISAQVAKNALILTLPAPIIREQLKTNNNLAMNILKGMSLHSQMLIQGLESIRLKSATERVGWFLLKLLMEQGRVPDLIELPYDKSLIASYLDMKPETFSRTLKKFKQRGFEINKNSVIMPNVTALCGFCDSETASSCARHGTSDCPNPDCVPDDMIEI